MAPAEDLDCRRVDGAPPLAPPLGGASTAFIASLALRSASFRYLRKISLALLDRRRGGTWAKGTRTLGQRLFETWPTKCGYHRWTRRTTVDISAFWYVGGKVCKKYVAKCARQDNLHGRFPESISHNFGRVSSKSKRPIDVARCLSLTSLSCLFHLDDLVHGG